MSEFDSKDDFTVVVQPFDLDITFPMLKNGQTDFSYLSTDCFHFSQKGYARGMILLSLSNKKEVKNNYQIFLFSSCKCSVE